MVRLARIVVLAAVCAFFSTIVLEYMTDYILEMDEESFLDSLIERLETIRSSKNGGGGGSNGGGTSSSSSGGKRSPVSFSSSGSTSSSSSGSGGDRLKSKDAGVKRKGPELIRAIWSEDFETVTALCDVEGGALDVNYNDNGKGTALYRAANMPGETDRMLAIVNRLLRHPGINPNGGYQPEGVKQPLKAALWNGNKEIVKLLMQHPDTSLVIDPSGLSCAMAAEAPKEISFYVDETDGSIPECFKARAANKMTNTQKTNPSSPGAQAAATGAGGVGNGALKSSTPTVGTRKGMLTTTAAAAGSKPAPIVLDPAGFDSLTQTAVYYFFGRFQSYSPYVELAVLTQVLLISATLLFGFGGLTSDLRRKEKELLQQEEQAQVLREAQAQAKAAREAEELAAAAAPQAADGGSGESGGQGENNNKGDDVHQPDAVEAAN